MLKINSIQSIPLDLVALIAAQAVLIGYLISFFDISKSMPYIQNTGVILFFILSGLIISYTVIYKNQTYYSFKLFFIERFARIYTGLIPSLLFILVIAYLLHIYNPELYGYAFNIQTFIGNIFMLQDYQYIGHYLTAVIPSELHITLFGSGCPLWTLAIEWWLYMCFGLLYFFYLKSFDRKYLSYLIIVSIVPLWNLVDGRGTCLSVYWLFGLSITLFVFKEISFSRKLSFLFAVVSFVFSIVILIFTELAYSARLVFFLASFLFFMLLYQQENDRSYNGAFSKIIKYLAGYSFTLYLVRYTIISSIVSLHLNFDKYTLAIFSFFTSNIIALGITLFNEMKHKKFAEKLKQYLGVQSA